MARPVGSRLRKSRERDCAWSVATRVRRDVIAALLPWICRSDNLRPTRSSAMPSVIGRAACIAAPMGRWKSPSRTTRRGRRRRRTGCRRPKDPFAEPCGVSWCGRNSWTAHGRHRPCSGSRRRISECPGRPRGRLAGLDSRNGGGSSAWRSLPREVPALRDRGQGIRKGAISGAEERPARGVVPADVGVLH